MLRTVRPWHSQVSVTPEVRKDIPASSSSCFELQAYANTHQQQGFVEVQLVFEGWVGVKHDEFV